MKRFILPGFTAALLMFTGCADKADAAKKPENKRPENAQKVVTAKKAENKKAANAKKAGALKSVADAKKSGSAVETVIAFPGTVQYKFQLATDKPDWKIKTGDTVFNLCKAVH